MTPKEVAKTIDHTILKPDATHEDLKKLCQEAVAYGFKAVCVNSCHVALVSKIIGSDDVNVCSVVGFPLGAMQTKAKAFEAEVAVEAGANELDMVLNIGALKSGDTQFAETDIKAVRQAAGKSSILKVIIETCLLTEPEKILACQLAQNGGADYVKTSTGFSGGGATVEDVRLMRKTIADDMRVKASGGIKDWDAALAMIKAGASRIGTSSGVTIVQSITQTKPNPY
jgi:deoxyribose-phosphate aldolase